MDNVSATKGEAAMAAAAAVVAVASGIANEGANEVDPALEAVLKLRREKSEDGLGDAQKKTLRFEDV
jgi:hypothetical protein